MRKYRELGARYEEIKRIYSGGSIEKANYKEWRKPESFATKVRLKKHD